MSRHKTDPIVMERVRQIIYDTGLSNKELSEALGLNVNTIGSWGHCALWWRGSAPRRCSGCPGRFGGT